MLSFIYDIFRRLFGKASQPPPKEETPVSEKEKRITPVPEPQKKVIDVREKIRHQQQKKHARRLANRGKQVLKTKDVRPGISMSRIGIPLLSEHDNLAKLFNINDKDIEIRSIGISEELLIQKEQPVSEKSVSVKERLKKYPAPAEELDLHGCSGTQAVIRTEEFIIASVRQKRKTVRVVVGKGLHSEGKAVLKEVVEDKLVRMKQDGFIFTFRWEKDSKLRSGAIIVYLHQEKEV